MKIEPSIEISPSSKVIEISRGGEIYRSCHLVSFLPISLPQSNGPNVEPNQQEIGTFQLSYEFGGYLAAKHLNERNDSIVPKMHEMMGNCNIQFTYEMFNTQSNVRVALKTFLDVVTRNHSLETPRPLAVIGEASSKLSAALANLAGSLEIPQVSGTSTAASLDDKVAYPFFSRMIPTNDLDSLALAIYFKSMQVSHFGMIYVRDAYGIAFRSSLVAVSQKFNLTMYEVSYENRDKGSLIQALQYLKSTKLRYFFGIFHHESWKMSFREGYRIGIMGQAGYSWLISENVQLITKPEFQLDANSEQDIAQAMNGIGVLMLSIPQNPVLTSILKEFDSDQQLQGEFVSSHVGTNDLFKKFNFSDNKLIPSSSVSLFYDAVVTVGISACQQRERFFSDYQLLQTIRNQKFEGASGFVHINSSTGTRDKDGMSFAITNVALKSYLPGLSEISFDAERKVRIEFPDNVIHEGGPYVFTGGSIVIPEALPELVVDMNLIPRPVQILGLSLSSLCILASLFCTYFVFRYRRKTAIRMAQPEFLYLISSGCALISSAIIPMSLQEPIPKRGLDISCMSSLYLFSIGFVLSFSALFCKTWRINKIIHDASRFRRVTLKFKDFLAPLITMLSINLTILIMWTMVDPLKWTRTTAGSSFDPFGRPRKSYPFCSCSNDKNEIIFCFMYASANGIAVLFANYESYKARKNPDGYNETGPIALAMFIILEAILVGIPVLFAVQRDHTANFVVRTILVVVICMGILLPIFLPLWMSRSKVETRRFVGSIYEPDGGTQNTLHSKKGKEKGQDLAASIKRQEDSEQNSFS